MLITERGPGFRIDMDTEEPIEELVREYTMAVLKKHGRVLQAAMSLGIGYGTLYLRLKRYRDDKRDRRTIRGREGER